jgi:hypothetical protein
MKDKNIFFMWCIIFLVIGFLCGMALGIVVGQKMIFREMAMLFSNIEVEEVNINVNTTYVVEEMKDILIPFLNQTIERGHNETNER